MRRGQSSYIMLLLWSALVLVFLLALSCGESFLSPLRVLKALWGRGEARDILIVQDIRAPRAVLAILTGAGLGAAGAALQGYFRNPLADPGITGVSASAGLGAVLAFYFGWAAAGSFTLAFSALLGGFTGLSLLFLLAGRGAGPSLLILAGVAVNAFAAALTALVMSFAPNPWALSEIVFWLMGSLKNASWADSLLAAPLIIMGTGLLAWSARALDALTLGEETAASLGINLTRTRMLIFSGTALAVGAGVAVAGAVGFVGLIAPHLMRPLFQHRPGRLIIPSALAGGLLILMSDTMIRVLSGPRPPLYLGVVTALLGAPFFLYLITKMRMQA